MLCFWCPQRWVSALRSTIDGLATLTLGQILEELTIMKASPVWTEHFILRWATGLHTNYIYFGDLVSREGSNQHKIKNLFLLIIPSLYLPAPSGG